MRKPSPEVQERRKKAYELHLQGLSYSEIAKELGISKSSVQKYINDYKKQLEKEQLKEEKSESKEELKEPVKEEPKKQTIEQPKQNLLQTNTLPTQNLNQVITELNQNVSTVPEPKKEQKEKKTIKDKLFENKYLIIGTFVGILVIGGVLFFVFKKLNEPKEYYEEKIKPIEKEIEETTKKPEKKDDKNVREANGKKYLVLS